MNLLSAGLRRSHGPLLLMRISGADSSHPRNGSLPSDSGDRDSRCFYGREVARGGIAGNEDIDVGEFTISPHLAT